MPESKQLLRKLRSLEHRRGASGRDRVDHSAGGYDDLANAVAGVVDLVLGKRRGLSPTDLYPADEAPDRWSYDRPSPLGIGSGSGGGIGR
jgi:hypothetical protein